MGEIKEGMQAPEFKLDIAKDKKVGLSDFKGKKVVLYFYPKDDTPGCTLQAKEFSGNVKKLQSLNCEVLGVSRDDLTSHGKFSQKYCLAINLASDSEGDVCKNYGVWKEKSMYGKKYMGIERSTFLIDEVGKVLRVWRNVKVDGHVDEVLKVCATKANNN